MLIDTQAVDKQENVFVFDPTRAKRTEFGNASVGKTPNGNFRVTLELPLNDLRALVGYDPRTILRDKKGLDSSVDAKLAENYRGVQRSIDKRRVDEMVAYLHAAATSDVYADWGGLTFCMNADFDPDTNLARFAKRGKILLPMRMTLGISDGQHRFCALLDFARRHPSLMERFTQTLTITFFPETKFKEFWGQDFHDRNRFARVVAEAKALEVDTRDLYTQVAKEIASHEVVANAGGIGRESSNLTNLGVLRKFVRSFIEGRRGLDKSAITTPNLTEATRGEWLERMEEYVEALGKLLPSWADPNVREDNLDSASAALQALGVVGHELFAHLSDPVKRVNALRALGQINWSRTNFSTWNSVIGQPDENGSMIIPSSTRQAFDATIKFLRSELNLKS